MQLRKQKGATLIVALVLLAIVTVIGLSSIRSSNLELKMATSARDRADALRKSEEALDVIRQLLDVRTNNTMPAAGVVMTPEIVRNVWPSVNAFSVSCTERNPNAQVTGVNNQVSAQASVSCFTEECNRGFCFSGDMQAETKALCKVSNPDTSVAINHWQDKTVWDAAGRYGVIKVAKSADQAVPTFVDVKYLVEMLCFTPRSDATMDDADMTNAVPLYRVTTMAVGAADRSTVVLQSVIKGNLL